MTLAEQLRRRADQLSDFSRWEHEHPAPPREFIRVLADLSAIRRLADRQDHGRIVYPCRPCSHYF